MSLRVSIGDRVHAPNRRNSKRHSSDQIGGRVNAPAGDTVYIDQIGDKVHVSPGDTVELLSFMQQQKTQFT